MPRNCSRTATLATWTILSALCGGLAGGQLAEEVVVGGKSAYGGGADVVVVSIYDARKNEAGCRQDGCALKSLIQAPSEPKIAGNGAGREEKRARGIIRPSKVIGTGFIGAVLSSENSQDAASRKATYGEYGEAEESGRSGRAAGEANNSVDAPKVAGKDVGKEAEAGGSSSESYRSTEEATLDPESSWIFGKAIKRSEGRSQEQVGRNEATSANGRGIGTRKIETSPRRDTGREGGGRKSLAIGVSRSFGTSRHEGRRSRRELAIGDRSGDGTGDSTEDGTEDGTRDGTEDGRIQRNEDNVRGNLQFEDLTPSTPGRASSEERTSPCDSSNELGSATTDCDPERISREKIGFEVVTAASRDPDFLPGPRDLVYRSILRQKSTNWHHSVPEPSFNYESSTLTQLNPDPRGDEKTVVRTRSNSPTSSEFVESATARKEIETRSETSTERYVHPSAAESRVGRNSETLNFFQTSPAPLSSPAEESALGKDAGSNRMTRAPEFESRKNSLNNGREGRSGESSRQNEILESKQHASHVFAVGEGGARLPMPNMDRAQVQGTTGVGLGTSTESQIVRDAAPTFSDELTVAPDYPEKDEDQDSDERLGQANGFVSDMLANSGAQSEASSTPATPEYRAQSPQTETIAGLSSVDIGASTVLSSPAGEKKLNGGKRTRSKWQLYGDREDQTEREPTYTEPSFSHGARRTSSENVRTNILPISTNSCADQNGYQIPSRRKDGTSETRCAEGSVPGEFLDTEEDELAVEVQEEKGSSVRSQATASLEDHNKRHLASLPGRSQDIEYSARRSASRKSGEVQHSAEMAGGSDESDSVSRSNASINGEVGSETNDPTGSTDFESSVDSDLATVSSLDFSQVTLTTGERAKDSFITLDGAYPMSEVPPIPNLEDGQELSTTPKGTLASGTPLDVSDVESRAPEGTAAEREFNFSESSEITGASPWRSLPSSSAGESNSEETGVGYSSPDREESSAGSSVRPESGKSTRVPSDAGRNSMHSRYDTSGPIASTPTSNPKGVGLEGTSTSVVGNVLASSENPRTRRLRGKKVESPARNPDADDGSVSGPIDVGSPKSSPTKNPNGHGTDVEKSRNDVPIALPRSSASVDTATSAGSLGKDAAKSSGQDSTRTSTRMCTSDSDTEEDVIVVGLRSTAATSGTESSAPTATSAMERTSAEFDGTVVREKLNGFQTNASIIGPNGAEGAWELSSRKAAGLNRARTRSFAEESASEEPLDGITSRPAADRTALEDSRDRRSWPNNGDDGADEVTLPAPSIGPLIRPSAHGQRLPKPSKRSGAKLSASGATPANAGIEITSAVTTKVSFEAMLSGSELPDDKARTTESTSTTEIDFGPGFGFTRQPAANESLTATEETFAASESGSRVEQVADVEEMEEEEDGEDGSTVGAITRVSSSAIESGQFGRTAHLPDPGNPVGTKDFPLTTAAVPAKGSENSSQDEASLNQWPVKHSAVVEGDLVLGGLMMVHEREDTVTCGPVMPQGGVQALEAMLYTLDTLNDMEIVPGVKIGAHILDDCDKDTYGLEMAVDFIKGSISNIDGAEYHCNKTAVRKVISGVVGAASSVTSIQVANLLRLFRIPQVSFFSTSPELSNKQRFEYFTRTIPSDHYQVKAMVDIVLTMGWSYVSIIYEESNYGIKAFEELEELLAKNEICIAVKEKLVKDSGVAEETAYDNIVLKLLTKPRARGCIIFGSDQEVAGVMRAVRRCNATGAFSWIGSDGWSARGLVSNGNEPEVEGTLSVQPQANPVKGFEEYFLNLTVENNRRNPWFVEFWEDHFQCRYPNASRTPYNQKYTKMCTTKERLTKQNTAFEDQLQFVSDAVMAFAYAFRDMHMDLCGGKSGLCDAMKPTKGTELLKYLRKVDFEGLSGDKFKFDKNGDGPARYNIIHFKQTEPGRYKWIRVGKYLQGELRLNMSEIQFKLGHPQPPESVCSLPCEVGQPKKYVEGERCCWHCFNCTQYQIRHPEDETQCIPCRKGTLPDETHSACRDIPEEFLRTESGWAIGAMSFSATGILVTLFVAGVFVRHNETPIVRASGRELSYVLLWGILLCYLVTFALVLKPSDIVCGIQRFAVGFCFTVVYAALLTKTNRIARIFNASKHSAKRPSFISPRSQLIICSGLVGVQILINGVWMVIDPARAIHHYPTREDNLLVCNSYIDASYMIAFAYPIMLIVVCTVYAVITRKIPEAFNESKHIGFTMYTTCVIWLAFVPLYFGTGNHVALRITSMSVTISLSASVTIACLFSPKLYIILIRPERNVRQSMMIGKYGTTKSSAATTNASSMMAPVALTAATCDQSKAVKKHIIATIDCSTQSEYYELEVKDQKNGKPPANVMSRSTQTQVSNNEKDTNAVASTNKEKESAATAKPINNNARIGNGPVAQSDVSL